MYDITIGILFLVIWLVGIVGNVLSAIVWIRRQVASSAIYLAATAINDIIYLLTIMPFIAVSGCEQPTDDWVCFFVFFTHFSSYILEPLLVLGFSVERLFAIYRPIQVCIRFFRVYYLFQYTM